MSEGVEIVNPLDGTDVAEGPQCFGQYDATYTECTKDCALNVPCKRHTEQAPKAAPPTPFLEEIERLPEISPYEFLIQSLKGRYDVKESETENANGKLIVLLIYKGKEPLIHMTITATGRYEIKTQKAKIRIDEIESVKQASEIFKAFLIL